jgi:hypothetical protein
LTMEKHRNNYQLSIINCQLSIVNYPLSIINYPLSIITMIFYEMFKNACFVV